MRISTVELCKHCKYSNTVKTVMHISTVKLVMCESTINIVMCVNTVKTVIMHVCKHGNNVCEHCLNSDVCKHCKDSKQYYKVCKSIHTVNSKSAIVNGVVAN